ncbi:MAG: hypothetical protein GY716_01740 [bacterium]|nr:hypothetical protein [bacterium]
MATRARTGALLAAVALLAPTQVPAENARPGLPADPAAFEREIETDAVAGMRRLGELASMWDERDEAFRAGLHHFLRDAVLTRGRRLGAASADWNEERIAAYVGLLFLDPERFAADPEFREFCLGLAEQSPHPALDADTRARLLRGVNAAPGIDFAASERIEFGWSAVPRLALEREVPFRAGRGRVVGDLGDSIDASIFSMPEEYFELDDALHFLGAVRAEAPERKLIVLTDRHIDETLQDAAMRLQLYLLPLHGREYSAWPRDPFTFHRRADGGVLLTLRPNEQTQRESDNDLGLELIQGLPAHLDGAWGKPTWQRSDVPFHNGQALLTPDRVWTSPHGLEGRVLQLLGAEGIDVQRLFTVDGWNRYVAAVHEAGAELAALYDRKLSWIFPLEPSETVQTRERITALGGGAGHDLDSVVSLLSDPGGGLNGFVGDLSLGARLVEKSSDADLDALVRTYGLKLDTSALRAALVDAQRATRAAALGAFLDGVARQLESNSTSVHRLPLLVVPPELVRAVGPPLARPFLLTWNNVVHERRGESQRVEGFASGLTPGDAAAREIYAGAGYELVLFPPLVQSIAHNGGYRCASQHLRR